MVTPVLYATVAHYTELCPSFIGSSRAHETTSTYHKSLKVDTIWNNVRGRSLTGVSDAELWWSILCGKTKTGSVKGHRGMTVICSPKVRCEGCGRMPCVAPCDRASFSSYSETTFEDHYYCFAKVLTTMSESETDILKLHACRPDLKVTY